MKINRNSLDEMQKARRNNIGNNLFMLMFFALLVDAGLYGLGIHWLKYPANVMVIISVCMSIYLVLTIAANAYLPPKTSSRKNLVFVITTVAFSAVLAIAAFELFGKSSVITTEGSNDNSALILFSVAAVGLIISLIVAVIKRVNNRNLPND